MTTLADPDFRCGPFSQAAMRDPQNGAQLEPGQQRVMPIIASANLPVSINEAA